MEYEYHTRTCRKYKIHAVIENGFDIIDNEKIYKTAKCSLMNRDKKHKCNGMERPDFPCPYVSLNFQFTEFQKPGFFVFRISKGIPSTHSSV